MPQVGKGRVRRASPSDLPHHSFQVTGTVLSEFALRNVLPMPDSALKLSNPQDLLTDTLSTGLEQLCCPSDAHRLLSHFMPTEGELSSSFCYRREIANSLVGFIYFQVLLNILGLNHN